MHLYRSLGLGSTSLEELDWEAEALESHSTISCASSVILPDLQNLRRICNMASSTSTASVTSSSGSAKLGASIGFTSVREQQLQGQKENVNNSCLQAVLAAPAGVVNRGAGTLGGKGVQSVPNTSSAGRSSKLLVSSLSFR